MSESELLDVRNIQDRPHPSPQHNLPHLRQTAAAFGMAPEAYLRLYLKNLRRTYCGIRGLEAVWDAIEKEVGQ